MNKTKHTIPKLLISITLILTISCEYTIDVDPETVGELNRDLVGCWELVSSDSLFEGNLFITVDGKGTEYALMGWEFRRMEFDFDQIDYQLDGDELQFEGRSYQRAIREMESSPCPYFPDEGTIKIFRLNEGYIFSVRIGYDPEIERFSERRSIWSPTHLFEQDTITYVVKEYKVWIDPPLGIYDPDFNIYWSKYYFSLDRTCPQYIMKVLTGLDTTINSCEWEDVELFNYWYYFYRSVNYSLERGLLESLDYGFLWQTYFAPEIGSILHTYECPLGDWRGVQGRNIYNLELVEYFNPLKTIEADRARRDYRHVQRYND